MADIGGLTSNFSSSTHTRTDSNFPLKEAEIDELLDVLADWNECLEKDVYKDTPSLRRAEP